MQKVHTGTANEGTVRIKTAFFNFKFQMAQKPKAKDIQFYGRRYETVTVVFVLKDGSLVDGRQAALCFGAPNSNSIIMLDEKEEYRRWFRPKHET